MTEGRLLADRGQIRLPALPRLACGRPAHGDLRIFAWPYGWPGSFRHRGAVMEFTDTQFWVALVQIIWIDLILSGDNAVVIALACRSLPENRRRIGIILGAGAAVGLRVIFAVFIIYLMGVPYLKLIGAALLLWIAVKLLMPEEEAAANGGQAGPKSVLGAVRIIVLADVVMSLDNVIAIAAASHGDVFLLVFGLLVSVPLILFGSTLILKAIDRYPLLITAGAALLGYIAGDISVNDPAIAGWVEREAAFLHWAAPAAGAVLVVGFGQLHGLIQRRRRARALPAADAGGQM